MHAPVRACMRACVRACVHVCVCVCVCVCARQSVNQTKINQRFPMRETCLALENKINQAVHDQPLPPNTNCCRSPDSLSPKNRNLLSRSCFLFCFCFCFFLSSFSSFVLWQMKMIIGHNFKVPILTLNGKYV